MSDKSTKNVRALQHGHLYITSLTHFPLFSITDTMQALDANVLRSSVSEVLVTQLNIELRLKNGQIIGMEDMK